MISRIVCAACARQLDRTRNPATQLGRCTRLSGETPAPSKRAICSGVMAPQARAPKPPFTFVEENLKGTVAKIVADDASGTTWDVKLAGEEAHPEVVANRLLWALGYPVQECISCTKA